MRRLVLVGVVLATGAVAYAAAAERLGFESLRGWFRPSQSLPALRTNQMPFTYPAHLWRGGIEGEVVLKIHITASGAVDSVRLERSSGHEQLDQIALRGARELAYYPATQGEQAVSVWAMLPVRFQQRSVTAEAEARIDE